MKNLNELYEIIGEKIFRRGYHDTTRKINKTQRQLNNLVENPEEFYQSKNASELSNLCKRIRDFYDI